MRTFKKLISAVTATAMTLSMAASGMVGSMATVSAADKTAVELVDDMGMGWNLGNTFDCWGVKSWESQTEKGWGNPVTSKAMIDAIKATGFDSVRIPVTWYENTDAGTFDIDDAYLARVKTVVDYAIENDMYAIINMHWDWVSDGSLWLNKGLEAQTQFTTMWTEIANYFKDYDEHLVFEDMNEVGWEKPYSYTANDYNTLNTLNQAFVDTVRATGGGNSDRLLLLAGANADLEQTCSSSFVVPDDSMVAVSIHYYLPPTFCVAQPDASYGYTATWGTDADKTTLVNNFQKMTASFVDRGVPVILGEYGVLTNGGKDAASTRDFLKTVASQSLNTKGISAFLWDSGQGGDMQYFDRETLAWRDAEIGQIYADLGNGNIENLATGWVEVPFEAVTDDDGNVVDGAYRINIGNATQVKLEIEAAQPGTSGVGGISYWDTNANDGKGKWVNNALGVNFTYDKNGNSNVSQTTKDENGETVTVNDNFFELPAGVATDSVQFQMFYVGYVDENDNWVDSGVAYPTLLKAYIPGVVDPSTVAPSEETPSEETPSEETPSEETPSEETPSEETPSEVTPSEETPSEETPTDEPVSDAYTFALHGQFGGNSFWGDSKDTVTPPSVSVSESGTYTVKLEAAGETHDGDMALFLDSDVNIYQYAINEDSTGIADGTLNVTVDSIKVDGVDVELGEMKLMTMDDGKSLRLTVVNPWSDPAVAGINADITVAESMEITFTVQLGLDEEQPGTPSDLVYGDVNGDGVVDIMDVIALNKFLLGSSSLEDSGRAAADVDLSGGIDSTDSLNILKKVVELVDVLPIQ